MATVVLAVAVMGTLYVTLVLALVAARRRTHARAWAAFIPDRGVLVRRLLADPRVPRRRKLLLGALVVSLAFALDLVPDFIPVGGQLDDAIVLALVLRLVLRSGGEGLLAEHWPGAPESLRVARRLTFAPTALRERHRQQLSPRVVCGPRSEGSLRRVRNGAVRATRMRLLFAASGVTFVLIAGGCGGDDEPAGGQSTVPVPEPSPAATAQTEPPRRSPSAAVSRSRAIAIARGRVGGGRVDAVERDDEDGRAVWKVKLSRAGGVEHEVSVAVRGGHVLTIERDRDDDADDGND